MNQVFMKVFKDPNHTLVAACDTNIIGATFREGRLKLEVKAEFYKGVAASIPDALQTIGSADIANLVGKEMVEAAVRKGLVDPSVVLRIDGIPHVQIVRL